MDTTTLTRARIESLLILALAELRKPDTAPLVSIAGFDAHHLHALCADARFLSGQLVDAVEARHE
jgi:hypothetical protein